MMLLALAPAVESYPLTISGLMPDRSRRRPGRRPKRYRIADWRDAGDMRERLKIPA
jgi:hypothetical protein